jgi:DNA-binding NarL/FixJ family response regulator
MPGGVTAKKIRVLVANQPRLMRELVMATLVDQPDIEVVGEVQEDAEIVQVVADSQPDFVIVTLDKPDERPWVCDALLGAYPQLRILALAAQSNRSVFYWAVVAVHSVVIEHSEEGILNALRGRGLPEWQSFAANHKPN